MRRFTKKKLLRSIVDRLTTERPGSVKISDRMITVVQLVQKKLI